MHEGFEQYLIAMLDKTRDPMGVALKAVEAYGVDNDADQELIAVAEEMVRYYVNETIIRTGMRPYVKDGRHFIEEKFEYEEDGLTFSGMVDAVLTNDNGDIVLVDWKTRGNGFYSRDVVKKDGQLYLYLYVLREKYGVHATHAYQVQFSDAIPAVPRLRSKRNGDKLDDYIINIGKTTVDVLFEYFKHLSDTEKAKIQFQYADKLIQMEDFILYAPVDVRLTDRMFSFIKEVARKIEDTKVFYPTLNAHVCKSCFVSNHCSKFLLEGG